MIDTFIVVTTMFFTVVTIISVTYLLYTGLEWAVDKLWEQI